MLQRSPFCAAFKHGPKEATLQRAQHQPGVHRLQNEFLVCIGSLDGGCDFLQREEQQGSGIASIARSCIWIFWVVCQEPEFNTLLALPLGIAREGQHFPSALACNKLPPHPFSLWSCRLAHPLHFGYFVNPAQGWKWLCRVFFPMTSISTSDWM